jgi:membrane associated rhomboid family serine protease
VPAKAPKPRRFKLPYDPSSWAGVLITMTALCAVLWIVEAVNASDGYRLNRYGLRPRDINGLEGILTAPFLHVGFGHLLANSAPFILIGWVVLLAGARQFVISTVIIIVVGGLATWLAAPSVAAHTSIVGVSGVVMGWLGYLLGRAYFSRRILWIVVAVAVVFFFGALLGGLLPTVNADYSWQGHLAGFVAGVLAAWVLHPRRLSRGSRATRGRGSSSAPIGIDGDSGGATKGRLAR